MAYQKQTWENAPSTNSPLSADRLNHMEDGIDNAYKQIKNSYDTSIDYSYSCDYANDNFETKGTVLWTNSNPTSEFASQTITLSSNDYDILEFYIKSGTTGSRISIVKVAKGYGGLVEEMTELNEGYSQYTGFRQRVFNYVDDTHYSFNSCLSRYGTNQSIVPYVQNSLFVPIYVVGYKTGLFS